ncbi:hypothetical protein HY57_10025 [Dyella japonica A8]|uniref:Uncharacterized protein n=1 Tax=Dyella japonica A8 TaxID=1217721 RepID=A0A075K1J1_9GAMM|nr:hypothetical protein HY57_10025 [Dyella japonica A8]
MCQAAVIGATARKAGDAQWPQQDDPCCWIGGHGTEPYEQNTQQSPAFGFSSAPQAAHSWKNTQAFVGMTSTLWWPHSGQVSVDSSISGLASVLFMA